jgi:uncharacterized protein YodC (DUF2158 family)
MSNTDKFNVGDIVKLKSGGPDMTVQNIGAGGNGYRCQWFAGKKLEDGFFSTESLELVEK